MHTHALPHPHTYTSTHMLTHHMVTHHMITHSLTHNISYAGDYDGLGKERRLELVAACALFGIEAEEVRVLDDPRFRDGMHEHWAVEEVERVVLKHLLQRTPDMVSE
jgi:LmbE family N-acetylglucosaminyl deacetylase